MSFKSGVSGNPKGRPKGRLNKRTRLLSAFVEERGEAVLQMILQAAVNDPSTARWLADKMFTAGDWDRATGRIPVAVAPAGELAGQEPEDEPT